MGPGGGPQGANRRRSVMAGRGAAIGAGQVENPSEFQGLQGQRHQGRRAAKGIEIEQIKPPLLHQAVGQQVLRCSRTELQATSLQGLQVLLQ